MYQSSPVTALVTAPAADPATSSVALTVAPAILMGAVTTCVHPLLIKSTTTKMSPEMYGLFMMVLYTKMLRVTQTQIPTQQFTTLPHHCIQGFACCHRRACGATRIGRKPLNMSMAQIRRIRF